MDTLIQWVKNLIFIILFTALLEMFLPESNMGKYVRIVMGFFIISILLAPISVIFRQDYTRFQYILPESFINDNWAEIEVRGREMEEANRAILMNYYQEQIAKQVREIVSLHFADYRQDIDLALDDDYRIDSLTVFLTEPGVRTVEIKPVKIAIGDKGEEAEERAGPSGEKRYSKEKLEYSLSQFLQVSEDKVQVVFRTGGN
ncbi:MAG: stage III sporulation protein AF [Halanaerobiaceae bacterium]|nr:stage III sporulation protein AF [Halanaerobiaceae bacterium]